MGRPVGTKNIMRTPKEKAELVKDYLKSDLGYKRFAEKYDIYPSIFYQWIKKYREKGIKGLESKTGKFPNQNVGKYNRHPSEIDKLKTELLKKEIEIKRLKKGYQVKGVGAKKEYDTIFDANMK